MGKINRYLALGVESALIALNAYGKNFKKMVIQKNHSSRDVTKSTRIDNFYLSTKDHVGSPELRPQELELPIE